jgi:hypothetical protein
MVALKEVKVLIKYARKIEAIGKRTFQQLWGDYSVLYKCFNDENLVWGVSSDAAPEAEKRRRNNSNNNNNNNNAIIAIIDLELLIVRRKIAKALSGQYLNLNNADATDATDATDADSIVIDRNNCERYPIAHKHYTMKYVQYYKIHKNKYVYNVYKNVKINNINDDDNYLLEWMVY